MLFNGASTVFHTSHDKMFGMTDKVFVQDDVWIETGCEYKGRALLAGFDNTKFWNIQWQHFFESWAGKYDLGLDLDLAFQDNMVWWSTIGGGDLLWLFYPYLHMTGINSIEDAYTMEKPLIFDYLKRNECGFMPMNWQGRVRHLIPFRDVVMGYGDNGVSALRSVVDPQPTMGLVDIL